MALDVMWEHWVDRCEYAFKLDELKTKINTAYHIAQNDPGVRTLRYKRAQAQRSPRRSNRRSAQGIWK